MQETTTYNELMKINIVIIVTAISMKIKLRNEKPVIEFNAVEL